MGLSSVNNLAELFLLLFRQVNISGCPVLLQPLHLSRTRDSNHTLGGNPSECDLTDSATLTNSQLLNLLNNSLVPEEVLTLEFRRCVKENALVYDTTVRMLIILMKTYSCDGNHPAQNHRASCSQSCLLANRGPEGYKRHRRRPIPLPFRSSRLSRGASRRLSTLPEGHRSWQLPIVSENDNSQWRWKKPTGVGLAQCCGRAL